jgi:hypothetical protein
VAQYDLHGYDSLVQWATAAGLVASQAQFEDIYGLDPEVRLLDPLMLIGSRRYSF